jgi:flagellar basal-body rod protein FlgB
MKLDFFQSETLDAMGSYLGRLSQRQQIVASNLANLETPGFKTKDISFHATMQELLSESMELKTTRPKHNVGQAAIPAQAQIFEVQGLTSLPNSNNVDLDKELLKLGETAFGYSMITQMIRGKFRTIASSINEGRG